ncbi:hypothetical protein ACFV3N_01575 [Streptomyces bauhiniae]|uniref:hypothetical protein n=1 Tax=Streptomyces bauhiniae TaxID=2340725 RepID=UPI0036668BAE
MRFDEYAEERKAGSPHSTVAPMRRLNSLLKHHRNDRRQEVNPAAHAVPDRALFMS